MPNYQLHKPKEDGFIITSDEIPKEGESVYAIDTIQNKLTTLGKVLKINSSDYEIEPTSKGTKYIRFGKVEVFKIIAQQDQIDFSALKLEEQKKIGCFDIENLSKKFVEKEYEFMKIDDTLLLNSMDDWKKGFQKAQELLSDNTFTLEDMLSVVENIRLEKTTADELNAKADYQPFIYDGKDKQYWTINKEHLLQHINSIAQNPKCWDIELEMESPTASALLGGYVYKPKMPT